ncbi:MAG TPA: hypothetical protein VNT79_11920 [Phycisphaerae bacterium]|nr:hypothetical protein [Phycisphaerae bacterium]
MTRKILSKLALFGLVMGCLGFSTGACSFECKTDADNDIEDAVEEVGDKIEDAVD